MSEAKNYEPAFPTMNAQQIGPTSWHHEGMTLRDYFAAKAMQSMCEEVTRYDQFESCAKNAYKMAEAMLAAREMS